MEPANQLDTRPISAIDMLAVHWDGGPIIPEGYDPVEYYRTEARFHIRKDWGGGSFGYGLMYHGKIDRRGRAYLTRPFTHVAWHASLANERSVAVCVDATDGQEANDAQLAALDRVVEEWRGMFGLRRGMVWGHGELTQYDNATTCPGPRLTAYVRAYRKG